MILVCGLEPRLDHAERDELAEPFNDLLLGVRRQQRTQATAPADLLENSPVRDRQARVLILQRCRRSEEHTSELQSHSDLVCRLLLEKKKKKNDNPYTYIETRP